MAELIGRMQEKELLEDAYAADSSQFIAVYGRRRVGKTFLVRETFEGNFTFQHAGLAKGNMKEQIFSFCASLRDAGMTEFEQPANWLEAFEILKDLIRNSSRSRKVVFIDELSWMDTPRCDLMVALESFWNGWASARKDIVLIVCASATSWMLNKVIHNKGGLYNRLTARIALAPLTLHECALLAESLGVSMNRHQLLECYMIMGGVPFYWTHLKRGLSLPQNIDAMFFARNAPLKDEFTHLFSSLFRHPDDYYAIVEALGKHKAGMMREEIVAATKLAESGALSQKLSDLENCGFIRRYRPFGKKSKGSLYQLVDHFSLFSFKFLQEPIDDEHYWSNMARTPQHHAWCGLAFERVCLAHIPQIKAALGISGVATSVHSWACKADPEKGTNGSQIDLIIARQDHVINLCEMKYSANEFTVTHAVEEGIRRKVGDLQLCTNTKSAIHVTFIAPYGIAYNEYSGIAQSVINADDLFA